MATVRSIKDGDRRGAAAIGAVASGSASLLPSGLNGAPAGEAVFETLKVRKEGAVLFGAIAAPPMNLLGPALARDLVSLIQQAEADHDLKVLVFRSADPDYFISHLDVTRIQQYRQEAGKLTAEAWIALMFRHLSASRLATSRRSRAAYAPPATSSCWRGHVLCCPRDGHFCSAGTGIWRHSGGGGIQHLARVMGRARALEAMLSAEDYDADLAERYGWINRALPANELGEFVSSLAHRIAKFPADSLAAVKDRVNAIALAPAEEFRRDSDLFGESARNPEPQSRFQAAFKRGFQTREAEMDRAGLLGDLAGCR